MSEDSYAARRAMRVAGAAPDSDGEEVADAVDQLGGAVQRPGQETDDPAAQGKQGGTKRQPRPKLTYELLTAPVGVPSVFGTFREAFRKQRNGKKNITRDLGLLLELYEQWQKQVYPHDDFDKFSKKVANLYGAPGGKMTKSATLKADMRQLRESVIDLALEGMEDAVDVETALGKDGDTQGHVVASQALTAADGIIGTAERIAASQCTMNHDSCAVGSMVDHTVERVDHFDQQSAGALGAMDHAMADRELDDLMNAQPGGDDEYWEDDALDDMMVAA